MSCPVVTSCVSSRVVHTRVFLWITKQILQIEQVKSRNPTDGRQNIWLFTLPAWLRSQTRGTGLKPVTHGLQIRRPHHSAMLPLMMIVIKSCSSDFWLS